MQPHIIFWEITQSCNLHCPYCRREADSARRFSLDEAKAVIDSISREYRPLLIFSGGEPLTHPELSDIVAYARERGFDKLALATNGTLIDKVAASRIRAMDFHRVAVSLDSASPETNDAQRGDGSFSRILRGLYYLRAEGITLQVNATITRRNFMEIELLYRLCTDMGVKALHLFAFVPVGCGMGVPVEERLSAKEYESFLEEVSEMSRQARVDIKVTCAPHYYRILKQKGYPSPLQFSRGCLAGTAVCFISCFGEVYPCGYLPVSSGNVLREPFEKIWKESRMFDSLRRLDSLKGRCGRCEYVDTCGGCRARAYSDLGDYLQEEPDCVYQPLTEKS